MTAMGRGPNAAIAAATMAPTLTTTWVPLGGRGGGADAAARGAGRAARHKRARRQRQHPVADGDHAGGDTADRGARDCDRQLRRAQGAHGASGAGQTQGARGGTRVRRVQQLPGTGDREQRARGEERPAREGRDVVRAQAGPPHMPNSEAVAGSRIADPRAAGLPAPVGVGECVACDSRCSTRSRSRVRGTRRANTAAYKDTLEQALAGERAGFHAFWTVEHHFLEEYSHCSNPEVLYGAIAARTERMRLGYGVRLMPKPYNHPVRTAESVAVLDLLSDGRVDFGTGRSATRIELEGFGVDPHETREMWREAIEHVVGCWTNDRYSFEGKHWSLPERRVPTEAAPAAAPADLGRDDE